MDMPINVPVDDPEADTEWNDILRKHKIIPEKPPSPTPIIQEAIENARALAHENRLEDKNLEELNALEDEEEDEFLQKYRNQRLAELSKITKTSVFNQVYHLQKPDYSKDVTEASQNALVLVHLTSSLGTNVESRLLTELWRELATKYGDIKFCEIQANMCIEGYPEKNTPTILIYSKGNINRQLITLRELKGISTRLQDLEELLIAEGGVTANDQRLSKQTDNYEEPRYSSIRSGGNSRSSAEKDSDDVWD